MLIFFWLQLEVDLEEIDQVVEVVIDQEVVEHGEKIFINSLNA